MFKWYLKRLIENEIREKLTLKRNNNGEIDLFYNGKFITCYWILEELRYDHPKG